MRKTFKYRIYLTKGQRRLLDQQLEICRWVYNETLAERKRVYEERGETLRLYETQAMLPVWKLTKLEVKNVHSQVLQNVQVRIELAFQSFFRRVKEGCEKVGFPRFKGLGRYDSITYPQYGNGIKLDGTKLLLSKVGVVEDVAWSQFIEMTVSKAVEAGRRVILVDPRNTSKMCSRCSEIVPKTLSDRIHSCLACGLAMDRDTNAAINILHRGLCLQT